jgi:hypothetical protein
LERFIELLRCNERLDMQWAKPEPADLRILSFRELENFFTATKRFAEISAPEMHIGHRSTQLVVEPVSLAEYHTTLELGLFCRRIGHFTGATWRFVPDPMIPDRAPHPASRGTAKK